MRLGHLGTGTAVDAAATAVVVKRYECPGHRADNDGRADQGYNKTRETFHGMGMLAHDDISLGFFIPLQEP